MCQDEPPGVHDLCVNKNKSSTLNQVRHENSPHPSALNGLHRPGRWYFSAEWYGQTPGPAPVVELLTKMGVANHLVELGIMEISFAGLYLLPATRKLGFLLMSSYFSGALAVELAHSFAPVALGPLVIIWISAFLRDRSMFIVAPKAPTSLIRYPYDVPVVG